MIRPTGEAAACGGVARGGPYAPAPTLSALFAGEFDSVAAMYHNQGQIASKLKLIFDSWSMRARRKVLI